MRTPLIKKIKVPLYRSPLWIVIHPSIAKAIDYIEDRIDYSIADPDGRHQLLAYATTLEDPQGCQRAFLFIRPGAKPGEIAHECKHLVNQIFSWYGVRLSTTNDESECYYLDWFVDQAHNTLNRYHQLYPRKSKHRQNNFVEIVTNT